MITCCQDYFPLSESDPNFEIHQKIDSMLRSCREAGAHATLGQLYSEMFVTRDRAAWLTPALERLNWNLSQGSSGGPWAAHLSPLINLILDDIREVTAEHFQVLCERAAYLAAHNCHSIARKIAIFGWDLHRKTGLSVDQCKQLRSVYAAFGRHEATALYRIGWTLFRAEPTPEPLDPCWSAAVHRDLQAMPGNRRRAWLALLDANDHDSHFSTSLSKSTLKLLARIDAGDFSDTFARWTQFLKDSVPQLSYTGLTLLNWMLRLCAATPALDIDESLYRIAVARWTPSSRPGLPDLLATGWLNAYLVVLPARSPAGAFACVEALAMNPATRDFGDVAQLYQALLSTAVNVAAPPGRTVSGIDGFSIEPDHPSAAEQLALDQFLRAAHPNELRAAPKSLQIDGLQPVRAALVRQTSQAGAEAVARMIAALADRVLWLKAHEHEFTGDTRLFWRVETGRLMYELLPHLRDPTLEVLIGALQSDSLDFFGFSPGERIFELCQSYVDRHGWNANLIRALETWVKTLHGTISAQNLRRRAGWFLLFEEVNPIKIEDCWGNLVRADLRTIPEAGRKLWRAALGNASFTNADKPPAKWLKPARTAFAQLVADEFQTRFRCWFEPFRSTVPVKLTVPGRDLLRILMWYALIAENSAVDEALSWYAQAKWKNKASSDRAATTATAFAYVMPERNPRLAHQLFEEMLATGATEGGGKIELAYRTLCERYGFQPVQPKVPRPSGR